MGLIGVVKHRPVQQWQHAKQVGGMGGDFGGKGVVRNR